MNDDDDLSVFDDGPPRGIGSDGLLHSDPYCGMIAPFGTLEYRRGEACELCIEREDANEDRTQEEGAHG